MSKCSFICGVCENLSVIKPVVFNVTPAGLHEPQLQVEWSVAYLYSLVVEQHSRLRARSGVARVQ